MSWPYNWPWSSSAKMAHSEPMSITGGHGQWQQMADDDQFMDDAAFVVLRLQESSQPNAAHEAFQRILAALKSEPPYPYVGGAPSEPTTQEPRTAVSQWVGDRYVTSAATSEPEHGSQDVEGEKAAVPSPSADDGESGAGMPTVPLSSTTQEAEKALELIEDVVHYYGDTFHNDLEYRDEALAALRSLRTQHTELTKERDEWRRHSDSFKHTAHRLQLQRTKDQERIEELERALDDC